MLPVHVNGLQGALLAADEAQLAFRPGDAFALLDMGQPDSDLLNRYLLNGPCRAYFLALKAKFAAGLSGHDTRRKKLR